MFYKLLFTIAYQILGAIFPPAIPIGLIKSGLSTSFFKGIFSKREVLYGQMTKAFD